jgi:predicted small lipoprotein YifL
LTRTHRLIEVHPPAPLLAGTPVDRGPGSAQLPARAAMRRSMRLPSRRFGRAALGLALAASLAGCGHKTARLALPQAARAPIELEVPPEPENPPMIEASTEAVVVALPPPPPPPPPKRVTRKKTAPATPPPVQVASAPEPATLAIGALSTGGDSTPQSQQEAKDLIVSIQKRIEALPDRTANAQKEPLRKVRHFLDQAQQALKSGDAEGAKNLATKAKLLMDDVEKK